MLDEDAGELMEYSGLMKNPKYRKLYAKSYTKELGRLAQGMPGQVEGTNTIFFIPKKEGTHRPLAGRHLRPRRCKLQA